MFMSRTIKAPICRGMLGHTGSQTTSHFRALHNCSARTSKQSPLTPAPSSRKPDNHHEDSSLPTFSLLHQIRTSRPATRYTVYAGLGLMVTVESTFWFNVIRAKFFPAATQEDKEKAERLLQDVRGAIEGVRSAWMGNYGRYYEGYVWGVGER